MYKPGWLLKLACLWKGHQIIVEYPFHEQWFKNGTRFYRIIQVAYCHRCKQSLKCGYKRFLTKM